MRIARRYPFNYFPLLIALTLLLNGAVPLIRSNAPSVPQFVAQMLR